MRKLCWFGAGFVAACAAGAYWLQGSWALLFFFGFALLAAGALLALPKPWRGFGLLLLGTAVGLGWFWLYGALTLGPARLVQGAPQELSLQAADYSSPTANGSRLEGELTLSGRSYRTVVYLNEDLAVCPGDVLRGEFRLRYTGPGADRPSLYQSGEGVFLQASQNGPVTLERSQGNLLHRAARLRRSLADRVDAIFPGDTAAFAKALLLGDTADLPYGTTADLKNSGILHVVSVSGLHVSLLLGMVYFLLGRRRWLTPLVGGMVLLFTAAVTGFSPSIVRSCLMNGIFLLGMCARREYDGPTALAVALLLMLGVNPLAVTSVSLQLSAASILGILLFAGPIGAWFGDLPLWGRVKRNRPKRLIRSIGASVGMSLGTSVLTAPLSALHFGTVSLAGVLTNLLTIWLVNLVFCGLVLAVPLAYVWMAPARALSWVLSLGIRAVLWAAGLMGRFPLAVVYTASPYICWWLVFAYGLLGLFFLLGCRRRWQLALSLVLTLAVALGASWLEPRLDSCRITVLDVGQGQCILLQSGGQTWMVDCGGDGDGYAADKAVAALRSQGVFRLDGLVVSHYDRDHVGGVLNLLTQIPTDRLILPRGPGQDRWLPLLEQAAPGRVCIPKDTRSWSWEGAQLTVFVPNSPETSNESSLSVLFQGGNYDILITGDQTLRGELALLEALPRVDALVVGHHGADSSTGLALLSRTRPQTAIISVGELNGYGHPGRELLERLQAFGCLVLRTDRDGTVIIRR